MMRRRFKKKPIIVEAILWNGKNHAEIHDFISKKVLTIYGGRVQIETLEGTMEAKIGDWIIKGIKEEFYPCKPNIFKETYEEVTE